MSASKPNDASISSSSRYEYETHELRLKDGLLSATRCPGHLAKKFHVSAAPIALEDIDVECAFEKLCP